MKTISKFLVLVFATLFVVSCVDLNTYPEGDIVTEEQKQKNIEDNPSLLKADVAAIYSTMIELYVGDGGGHNDFGYAALCIIMDANGQDVSCLNSGYNWFESSYSFIGRIYTSTESLMTWNIYYKIIRAANAVLEIAPADSEDATIKAYRGQALAARAFAYLNMAQLYQFNYKGNEKKPCVPIVTETLSAEQMNNNPRATVQQVYDLIMSDLGDAIQLLDGFSRSDKGQINQAVAYGLRARANLVMQNWEAAASDAKTAISLSGAAPYSLKEVSVPTFASAGAKSVLWANIITENNDVVLTGIINWPSHLCSLFTDGYTSVGVTKKISKLLYDQIPDSDIRKQWWLNENFESTLLDGDIYKEWKEENANEDGAGAYANVKFGVYNDAMVNPIPAADWILMRYEELLLIQAEGLAMSGEAGEAKDLIDNFIRAERDPGYAGAPADAAGLQDEIWMQRRVELWGEGFSLFDILRLKKPIIRKNEDGVSNFPAAWQFNIPAEDPILLYMIPASEIEANHGIDESDNNPKAVPPTA